MTVKRTVSGEPNVGEETLIRLVKACEDLKGPLMELCEELRHA